MRDFQEGVRIDDITSDISIISIDWTVLIGYFSISSKQL